MLRPRFPFPLIILLSLVWSACDSGDAQRAFESDAAMPPAGITQTDGDGNVIGEPDPDDWRTAPLFSSITVHPVYPNPVQPGYSGTVAVPVSVPFTNVVAGGLYLSIYDPRHPERGIPVLDHIPPGAIFEYVELRFTRSELQTRLQLADARGLYRLYVEDSAGRLISYGDLEVR